VGLLFVSELLNCFVCYLVGIDGDGVMCYDL